jgi:hypothetical protein
MYTSVYMYIDYMYIYIHTYIRTCVYSKANMLHTAV